MAGPGRAVPELLVVLMNKAPLAIVMLWRVIPQSVEDLGVTLWVGEGGTLVHHLQGVEQSEHHSHFMLTDGCGGGKSNSLIRAFHVGQSKNLRLGALLKNLANYGEVHIISVGHNVVPREVVRLNFGLDLFFGVNGKVLLQQMMNNEVRVFVLSCNLDW